jgi:hypothetical protein
VRGWARAPRPVRGVLMRKDMEGPSLASRYVGLSLRVYIYGGGVGVWVGGGGGGGLFELFFAIVVSF